MDLIGARGRTAGRLAIGEVRPGADETLARSLLAVQHAAYAVEAALIGDDRIPPLHETLADLSAARDALRSGGTVLPLAAAGHGEITTEIAPLAEFYYAEDYHQQYLSDAKNPGGYCNHGPNGMTCPVGVAKTA